MHLCEKIDARKCIQYLALWALFVAVNVAGKTKDLPYFREAIRKWQSVGQCKHIILPPSSQLRQKVSLRLQKVSESA